MRSGLLAIYQPKLANISGNPFPSSKVYVQKIMDILNIDQS